jgi:N4-(beta-N-acetylglucosaminyl)-L-asparaginase
MTRRVNRREFVKTGAAAAGVAALAPAVHAQAASTATGRTQTSAGPTMMTPRSVAPVVVCSANGNRHTNGGRMAAAETAFSLMIKGGDVLDALIEGVKLNELDPKDTSVGYGGLPNADGVVQLDASCMHGPKKRAGAVACLEGVRTPSVVAKLVLEQTDHHLIVGKDAQRFAWQMGLKVEDDLNTEESRRLWLEWKRRSDSQHYLDPKSRAEAGLRVGLQMVAEGLIDRDHFYGTINCNGLSPKGEICGVTTTSGLAWKIPGRVGDSPILGAGLYVDGEVGAAGSTGRGEANLFSLASFLIVEEMRRGKHPKDAGLEALKRIKANQIEKRLLNEQGNPNFNIQFYALNAKGEYAGISMYPGKYAFCTEKGPQTADTASLLQGNESH